MGKLDNLKKASQRNINAATAIASEEKKPREKAFSGHGVSKVKTIKTSITVPEDVLHGMQTLAMMKRSTVSKMVVEVMSKLVKEKEADIKEFDEKYGSM